MKDLKRVKGRFYIARLIEEGEHVQQDFKFAISDPRKIARSISAFANTRGGHLLVGVKDNGVVAGVRNEEDIYVIEQAAERYCCPSQQVEFTAFNAGDGLTVVRAHINPAPVRPVCVDEGGGVMKAYCRVADENIVAHPLMLEAWSEAAFGAGLGHDEAAVLDALAASEPRSPEDVAVRAHLSMAATSRALVTLLRLKIVVFQYTKHGWCIAPAPDAQD